jgi:hypothetical protein
LIEKLWLNMMSLWRYEINDNAFDIELFDFVRICTLLLYFCFVVIGCLEIFVYVLDV